MVRLRPSDLLLHAIDLDDSPRWARLNVHRVGSGRRMLDRLKQEQLRMPRVARNLELLHLPWSEGPLLPPCPLVVNLHDLSTLETAREHRLRFRAYYNTLLRAHLRRAALVIVPSHATLEAARARWPGVRYCVVPYGVDSTFCGAAGPPVDREPVVLYTGGFDPRKRFGDLLTAFEAVSGAESKARLVVSGDAPPLARRRVAAHPAADRITLTGYVDDHALAAWYRRARVVVYPSELEGFGFPILEAFASGAPVVATNAGSIPELAGGAALLVGPRSPQGLAEALLSVLRDDALATELCKAGKERVGAFSWEATARQTLDIYRELLG
jgi:glycosyltransferase involved in cell wall biosynthesis